MEDCCDGRQYRSRGTADLTIDEVRDLSQSIGHYLRKEFEERELMFRVRSCESGAYRATQYY